MNKEHTLIRLVDDDESLLFSTKILLEALGWKVAAYNSPTEFLVRDNLSIPGLKCRKRSLSAALLISR